MYIFLKSTWPYNYAKSFARKVSFQLIWNIFYRYRYHNWKLNYMGVFSSENFLVIFFYISPLTLNKVYQNKTCISIEVYPVWLVCILWKYLCNLIGNYLTPIGEDGPSQMALEDLSMFRSIPGSTVFYPSDAVSTERAIELAANTPGVCFIRTSRPNSPIIYSPDDKLQIGKARVSLVLCLFSDKILHCCSS